MITATPMAQTLTVTRMTMNTEGLLTLAQWLSPGFPVSAYAYSHGLERVIDRGALVHSADLRRWLEDVLCHGSGRSDAILLAAAYRAKPDEIADIDAVARAFAASSERLTETAEQGAAFARTVDAIWATGMGPLCYPVAVGRAARLKGLPLEPAITLYLHAMAAALTSVAVRLVPLGQTEGQQVLARLAPMIQDTCQEAITSNIDDLSSTCFALDIAAMHHETQYSKVFRT